MRRGAAPAETRWPCPVCPGLAMDKVRVEGPAGALVLDHCRRCGGVWFERAEMAQLERHPQEAFRTLVPRRAEPVHTACHWCQSPMHRDLPDCPACQRPNVLSCPQCGREMTRRERDGLVLDFCGKCEGVWFDHAELDHIWRASVAAVRDRHLRRGGRTATALQTGGGAVLEAMFWAPDLVFYGAYAAGHAAAAATSAAAEAASHVSAAGAAEAVTAAASVAGDAAGSVFEALLSIIAGIFE